MLMDRSQYPTRKTSLEDAPPADAKHLTPAERIACVWELTRQALVRFGAPLEDLTSDDLTRPDLVYQIGLPPRRIDLLTAISGVPYDEAWR